MIHGGKTMEPILKLEHIQKYYGNEGNITKAAQKLHISQPPLSNQLKALEEELGVKLIERGSRKVTLTDVGNLLYKRGKDMVNVFESTLNEVEDFKSGIEGVLKIYSK